MTAMQAWVADHEADPDAVDPDALADFARWVATRTELAGQTARLGAPSRNW
jgi:hypothetical protein